MAATNRDKMKEIIEAKKNKGNNQHKIIPNKKMGTSKSGASNMKTGGSNNKV